MSAVIDERVVEMRFDNKQFESNVQASLSTLDKLKASLKLEGAAKGFENVDKAAKGISLDGIAAGVEALQKRFSTFGIVGMRVLENLTDSAMNFANKTLSFITEGIIEGGKRRAMNIENAHFQLQGLLKDEEKVQAVMQDAMDSVDGTAYAYDEAAKAASQFSASGIESGEQMQSSLRAITGVAAMTNSEYESISRIFTTVAGNGRLMGDQLLQLSSRGLNAASTLADYMTKIGDGAKVTEGDVRKMVSEGEISFQLFAAAMDDAFGEHAKKANETFTGAMSNVKAALARIGAEFISPLVVQNGTLVQFFNALRERINDVKANIGPLADMFVNTVTKIADSATKYLSKLDLTGHFKAFYNIVDSLKNIFKVTWSIIKPIVQAFADIFPPMTIERVVSFTETIKKFTSKLTLSEKSSKNLQSTFKGLFAVLDIVHQAFTAVFKAIGSLLGGVSGLGSSILGITGYFGEWLVKLDDFIKKGDVFNKVFGAIVNVIKTIADAVKTAVKFIGEKFAIPGFELFHSLLDRLHSRMSKVGEAVGSMKSGVIIAFDAIGSALEKCKFLQFMESLWNVVKTVAGGIASAFGKIGSSLVNSLGKADFNGIIDLLNGLSFGAIAIGINKFVGGFQKAVQKISGLKNSIIGILNSVRGCFEAYQKRLQAGTLLKIAAAIAILAASLVALSLIDSDKLATALGSITVLFGDLMGSMAVFNKISGKSSGVVKSITAMIGIAVAIRILAGALKKVGDLSPKQLGVGLTGIIGLTALMVAAAKIMGRDSKTIIKGAVQMVIFAAAIKILTSACKSLSSLSWEELAKGLVGVGALLAEVSLFMNIAKFSGKSIMTATGIVILSAAIKVLASACSDFGTMKWEELGKGLSAIGVLLGEVTAFTKLTGNAKHVISTGVSLIAIAGAMKIFASAIKDFAGMKWSELARGLTGMAGALAAVTISVKLMPKNMIGIGVGLISVSAALLIVASALNKMGSMQWEEIAKGLVALGGSMAIIAVGLNVMKGTLSGSAAMVVAAAALALLTPVLSVLGAMSWMSIAKGLVAIAGAFAVIGVAGLVLTPLVPAILGLSGAFALIGVSILGIGAGLLAAGLGLTALAAGFGALAAIGTAGATAVVASLTVIITGIIELIPAIIAKIGEGIVELCRVIGESAGAIGEAVKEVVLMLLDVLVECVPEIADGALELVAGVLDALVKYTPRIVDSIFQFLIGVLEGIARNLPGLIKAAIDVLMAFFSGIVDALKGIDTDTLLKGIAGVGLLSALMLALAAVAALTPAAMLGVLGMGVVIAELALVLAAVGALAQIPGLKWLINEGGDFLQSVGTAIGKFIGGIAGGFMSGVSSQFPQIGSDLSAFMTNVQPFIEGAKCIDPTILEGVKTLTEVILLLTAADILESLTSWFTGGSSLSGFAEELVPFGTAMKAFGEEIKGIDGELIANAATAGKTLAEMADTLPNSGGVIGFFAGKNDMSLFGEQLVPFGKAMKAFANEVNGLDAGVITEAATAGKALTELADTVPNTGGVVSWFVGNNDLDMFGEQLIPFGKAMKEYSEAVSGIDTEAVTNSATAGKALTELADTVPNSGGLVEFFTGGNDLDTFGEKIVPFGKAMKEYSENVTGLDADVITNSANAAKALVELSDNLPKEGGLLSWFEGDNDIASFGEKISAFGRSFGEYYDNIGNVDVEQLNGVIAAFHSLVDLANGITDVDTSGMSYFAQNLTDLGNSGIDGFISTFTDADSRVKSAAENMLTVFINGANSKTENLTTTFSGMLDKILSSFEGKRQKFNTAGSNIMTSLIIGIKTKDNTVRTTFTQIINSCLTVIRNKFNEFKNVGISVMTNFVSGIRSGEANIRDMFVQVINGCINAVHQKYNEFYDAGKYLIEGFKNGVNDYAYLAEQSAKNMARAAADSAKKELDINSPSKVGAEIGGYFGMGFVNSIIDYSDSSYKAGADMAAAAKNGLANAVSKIQDFIDSGIDSQPTIRPVLDLSDVRAGAGQLTAILSRSQAAKISSDINRNAVQVQNGSNKATVGASYSFIQNNYSPKALSSIEIYRQTKNQFSALKGLVKA